MPAMLAYDPLAPETLANPYALFANLRESTPVFWHNAMQSWCLTRYSDCVAVLRDHERFARDRRRAGVVVPEPSLSVQSLDPPEQAPIRSRFMNALRAQDIAAIELRAQHLVASLLEGLTERTEFDVMAEIAAPLSVSVISDLLGVDPPEIASFAAVSDAIMRSMDAGLDPATAEPGRLAREELSSLVESWFHDTSREGLLSHVSELTAPASDTIDLLVRNTARVMFQGGYSTMTAAIGNAIHTLMQQPHALEQMRSPGLLQTGVDELVRYDGPVQGTSRIAMTRMKLGAVTVEPGDAVVALFASANHDPAQFLNPDELVLGRSPNKHLGYGWGTHSCIGTVPAQAALRALVRSLLEHPMPLCAAGPATRRQTATMRIFEALPATFRSSR